MNSDQHITNKKLLYYNCNLSIDFRIFLTNITDNTGVIIVMLYYICWDISKFKAADMREDSKFRKKNIKNA